MKTLYLLRHAKSSWKFDELSDHDRPLNKRGRNDAALMGEELASRDANPDLILSSPAVRAITTATLVAKELDYDVDKIEVDERIYRAEKHELVELLQSMPDYVQSLMLVGHNDAITDLANSLSPEQVASIPTSGVVCLTFNSDSWLNISKEVATFHFFDFPKNYK
ncbi:MAG: histidine phosphatase family protein [Hymenobacteraceae bacterium]|nr:histidine phosphatase family protein [Hymenobacteraceae bacterium]MDX5397928.1 histidine phosphatase family protein [Hymenobacteraceae bacterium]MDX5443303.1 histidine phosphatase family protein [Hymenobacteraceae bacterium]MDX5513997.1 histidine phosphatase family protein [Hymenobacteraceae bacterium]